MCSDGEVGGGGASANGGGGLGPVGGGGGGDQPNICINIIIRAERFEIHV